MRFYLYLICIIFLCSCNEKKEYASIQYKNIDHTNKEVIKIQDITSGFSIVPLETNDTSLIQYIKKIIIYDNKIFLLDSQKPMLAVFSMDGNFLTKIGRFGRGPDEFFYPNDFIVDEHLQQIEILDGRQHKIIIYDIKGNFLKTIPVEDFGDYFIKFSDGTYMAYTNMKIYDKTPYKLLRISQKGKTTSKHLYYTSNTYQTVSTPFLQIGIDKFIFSETPCDTVFQITKEEVVPILNIDPGKNKLPYEYRRNIEGVNKMGSKSIIKVGSPILFNEQIFIQFRYNSIPGYLALDTSNFESNYYTIKNTYDFAFGIPKFSSNDIIGGVIKTTSLNRHKRDPRFELLYRIGDKIPEIEKLRKSTNEADNPYLIFWNTKKQEL